MVTLALKKHEIVANFGRISINRYLLESVRMENINIKWSGNVPLILIWDSSKMNETFYNNSLWPLLTQYSNFYSLRKFLPSISENMRDILIKLNENTSLYNQKSIKSVKVFLRLTPISSEDLKTDVSDIKKSILNN